MIFLMKKMWNINIFVISVSFFMVKVYIKIAPIK